MLSPQFAYQVSWVESLSYAVAALPYLPHACRPGAEFVTASAELQELADTCRGKRDSGALNLAVDAKAHLGFLANNVIKYIGICCTSPSLEIDKHKEIMRAPTVYSIGVAYSTRSFGACAGTLVRSTRLTLMDNWPPGCCEPSLTPRRL
eukprot:3015999-Amphidinium_carterae.2